MFAIPGVIALVILIYARPQEFFERLRVIPLLHVFCALAVFGVVLDLRLRNTRLFATPQLPWALGLFGWASLTILIRQPNAALGNTLGFSICMVLFLLIAHGVQSFRALHLVAAVVLAMVLFVCGVGTHQGFAKTGCVLVDETIPGDTASGTHDGRPCETERECYIGEVEPGAQYRCERIGLLGTTSIGRGRVRYRGVLQDPNELALVGGAGLPLAFAFGQVRKALRSRLLVVLAFALVLACAILTASRGGQLVFLAVLGAYFVNRVGLRGLLVGGVLALPLLVLGGRGGADAAKSTTERVDCWAEALSVWREHPVLGVGLGRFGEYHYMTAHNSYLLALAELGLPGMLLFGLLFYTSGKVPFAVLKHARYSSDPQLRAGASLMRAWSMGLLAAFVGLAVGIFFLSFTYHYVLWIYVGLSGALYSAVRRHDPHFVVRLRITDYAIVVGACLAIIAVVYLYVRLRLG